MSATSLAPAVAETAAPLRARLFPNGEWVLLAVLAAECAVFGLTGHNFLGAANAFEITRLAVEIGLLALALTPIIITGGIDLSVGSMMGLAAVVMGALWRDAGVALPESASSPPATEAAATIEPTDRSMPPVAMTSVMPSATSSSGALVRRISTGAPKRWPSRTVMLRKLGRAAVLATSSANSAASGQKRW